MPQAIPSLHHLPNKKNELIEVALLQQKVFDQAQKKVVLSDFWEFCVEILGYENLQPFHNDLCNFSQDNRNKKRLILLPRGHLKSTIETVGYSLWRLAQNPGLRILLANATAPMAEMFLRQIKNHLKNNKRFISLFGDITKGADKWTDAAIRLKMIAATDPKENTITAFGIGGNLVSQHYDLMIYDDLVNRDNVHTADRIADVHQFYVDAQDLVDDPLKTEQIMIGTRWHEEDLYGTILDPDNQEKDEWAVMKREAVEGDYEIVRNSRGKLCISGGTVLYPFKYPRQALNRLLRSKGPSDFSAQYLNDPIPKGQSIFKYDFNYYDPHDVRGYEWSTYITVDPAFFDPKMKSADPDYTGIAVVKVPYTNDWYIWDLINQRFSPDELIKILFELDTKYKPKTIGLEATAWQKVIGYAARKEMRERNQFLPITELSHSGSTAKSKTDRIQALEPRYANGSVYHNKNIRHMHTLEQQLRRFPRTKKDDLVDALSMMLEVAVPPRRRDKREDQPNEVVAYPA